MSGITRTAKAHFVLVHGACHGAWCWYKISSLLEAAGYDVTCLDLTGAGIDLTDPNTVLTFQHYNRPLFHFLSNLPLGHKVILVGHSAAGLALTYALCNFTNQISMAIYVASHMEKPGSTSQLYQIDRYSGENSGGEILPRDFFDYKYGLGEDQTPTGVLLKKEYQRQFFYNLSPVEDSVLASMLLRPAPVRALRGAPLPETPEAEGVPRVYIRTLQDKIIEPSKQNEMISKWPPSLVFALDSDHSPFFSTPTALFAFLLQAADSINST